MCERDKDPVPGTQQTKTHDQWFQEQVQLAIQEADHPDTPWVSHEEACATWAEKRAQLAASLNRDPANFDRLCQKIASGFASMSEVEGIAEIESAVKALREGCELTDSQLQYLMLTEEACKGLGDVVAGRVHDARAVLDEIADQRYARILAGEKTIPWAEIKSALVARQESAKTSEKCEDYDAYLHGKVTIAREQIGRGEYSSSESVEATFTERRAKISNQVHGDEPPASCAE